MVQGPKRVAMVQQKRHRGKDDERVVDPLFFMNRLVNLFPELKDPFNEERILYGQVRYVTFTREKVLPLCEELAAKRPESDTMKKFCSPFGRHVPGRGHGPALLVTAALLNGLSDGAFQTVEGKLGTS